MANKYTLEMHADAAIVQKWSESEKKALRERLISEIQSWERVYGESNIEGLWYKLSKVDLGDAETRKEISEFIQSERKLKWGDAWADFEIPFAVLEKNMAAADKAAADKAKWTAAAKQTATVAEQKLAKDVAKVDEKVKQRALEYNRRQIKDFSERVGTIRDTLTKKHADIGKKLAKVEKDPTYDNVYDLQRVIKAYDASIIVSPMSGPAKGWQDGFFGELTMSGLEKIAWAKKAQSESGAKAGAAKPGEGGAVKAATSGNEAVSSSQTPAVAPATAPAATAAAPAPKAAPSATSSSVPVMQKTLSGRPLENAGELYKFGLSLENGKVWIIGAKWERKDLNSVILTQSADIDISKFNSAVSFIQDSALLIQSVAEYAVKHNWKTKDTYVKKVSEFSTFVSGLSETDPVKVKERIAEYIYTNCLPKTTEIWGDLVKRGLLDPALADKERNTRVLDYVRKDLEAYEQVSRIRAEQILAGKGVKPEHITAFVSYLIDWGSDRAPNEVLAKLGDINHDLKELTLAAFPGKAYPDFLKELKASLDKFSAWFEKARRDGLLKKPDGTSLSESEIDEVKKRLRAKNLHEIIQTTLLEAYAVRKSEEYESNPALKEFANIQGVWLWTPSDRTMNYIKNDLWKDIAWEVAALWVGAATGGLGYAGARLALAANWARKTNQVRNAYQIGTTADVAASVVGQGVWFELGHASIASLASGENKFSTTGLIQSAAFAGSFKAVAGVLGKFGTKIDFARPLLDQKLALSKIMTADALVAMGVSYGISWKQDESWTLEEALQAIALAVFMRGSMSGVSRFYAMRSTTGVQVAPAPQNPPPAPPVAPQAPAVAPVTPPAATAAASAPVVPPAPPVAPTPTVPTPVQLSDKVYREIGNDLWKDVSKSWGTKKIGDVEVSYDSAMKKVKTVDTTPGADARPRYHDNSRQLQEYLRNLGRDEKIFLDMQSNAPSLAFVNAFKVWNDKFIVHTNGTILKNNIAMTSDEILQLIRDPKAAEKLLASLYDSQGFPLAVQGFMVKLTSGGKAAGSALLDIASKPWNTNGFAAIPASFWNLARLPMVNTRMVIDTVRSDATLGNKAKEITKALLLVNKNWFDGKINTILTVGATAMIIAYVHEHVEKLKAQGKLDDKMSIWENLYEHVKNYLAVVNIILPPEVWRQVFEEKH